MRFTMYYIKQSSNCNFRDLEVSEEKGLGNLSNYISSRNKRKLDDLIQELNKVIDDFWASKKQNFVIGKRYWWVTVNHKGHLKTIHCKHGKIKYRNGCPKDNYFESPVDAYQLFELISSVCYNYGFPLR